MHRAAMVLLPLITWPSLAAGALPGVPGGVGGGRQGAGLPPPPVTVIQSDAAITLDNALVTLRLDTTGPRQGQITSIRTLVGGQPLELGNGANAFMFDFDNHDKSVANGHVNFGPGSTIRIVTQKPELAEVAVLNAATPACPFNVEMRYILRSGDPGFYTYMTYEHTRDMPAVTFEQTRAVLRAARGSEPFTHYIVDDRRKGPYPVPPAVRAVFDTTWLYPDNIIHAKYDYSKFIADDLVHGLAGKGKDRPLINTVGVWLIAPSREYVNGGPLRQELTSHQDTPTIANQNNIVLWMLAGNHFGGPNTTIGEGQEWKHFYGPAFVYINQGATTDDTWTDAKQRAAEEEARWPYTFVEHPEYPLERGTLTGTIRVSTGDSPKNAWVILAEPGAKDWCMASTGYQFWARADENGRFSIPFIRPGKYSLHVSGANQFEDYFQDNLEVKKGTTDIGSVLWQAKPAGKILWQIGTPDRSTQEFKNGDNPRSFNHASHYAEEFPEDVTFTIGSSQEAKDWNYAHFGIYVKKPYWSIRFNVPEVPAGKATLTVSLAAFLPPTRDPEAPPGQIPPAGTGTISVRLNGNELSKLAFKKSGMAFYRSGGQDSLRQTATVAFDAAALKPGENEIQLQIDGARQVKRGELVMPNLVGGAMYDAIRLEIAP